MNTLNDVYKELINNKLKDFDNTKHYLQFKCSNVECDVINYENSLSTAVISFRYRPNSGCYKCKSKILVSIQEK